MLENMDWMLFALGGLHLKASTSNRLRFEMMNCVLIALGTSHFDTSIMSIAEIIFDLDSLPSQACRNGHSAH